MPGPKSGSPDKGPRGPSHHQATGARPQKPQSLRSDIASPEGPSSLTTNLNQPCPRPFYSLLSTYHSRKVSISFQMSAFVLWDEGAMRARHAGWQIRPAHRLALWVGSDTLLLKEPGKARAAEVSAPCVPHPIG